MANEKTPGYYQLSIAGAELPLFPTWSLPMVRCDACGVTWGTTGFRYPTVDLTAWSGARQWLDPGPKGLLGSVEVAEFRRLVDSLRHELDVDVPLAPGAMFGRLRGENVPYDADFARFLLTNPVVSARAHDAMRRADLRGFDAVSISAMPNYVELEVRGGAHLPPSSHVFTCEKCGRVKSKFEWQLQAQSVPLGVDIFRPVEAMSVVIVSARFAALSSELGLTGATFVPITLS